MLLNKGISISYFLGAIKYDLLAIVLYASTIGVLDNFLLFKDTSIPLGLTSIIGTAVSLLLAFRTGQSYERWWEARIIWGAIVNDSRTLIRQVKAFYIGPGKDAFVKEFGNRQIYWCQALVTALRKQPLNDQVKQYMESNSIQGNHIPNTLLTIHSDKIAEAFANNHITEFQQVQLDNSIVNLCNSMGRCERIKNTVFPRSYSMLIHFLIYVFLTVLPFGLSDDNILLEIFLCITIPSIFIAIEKTSILMQDPFENLPLDTPMTTISRTIESNIREMIGESPLPASQPDDDAYYIL